LNDSDNLMNNIFKFSYNLAVCNAERQFEWLGTIERTNSSYAECKL